MSTPQNRVQRADDTREVTQRGWKPARRWDLVKVLGELDRDNTYAWRNTSIQGETMIIEKRLSKHLANGETIVNPADHPAFSDPRIKNSINIINGRVTRPGQVLTKFPKAFVEERREEYRRLDTERRTPRLQDDLPNANVAGMSIESQDAKRTFTPSAPNRS